MRTSLVLSESQNTIPIITQAKKSPMMISFPVKSDLEIENSIKQSKLIAKISIIVKYHDF